MPITQREHEIMEIESEDRMNQLLEEWRTGFLANRLRGPVQGLVEQGQDQGQTVPSSPNDVEVNY